MRIQGVEAKCMSTRGWIVTSALLLALVPAWVVHAQPVSKRLVTSTITSAVPDSVRLKVLALLAEGNVTGAVEYYLVATGARHAPAWLQGLQAAFTATNRAAGRCSDVARKLYEGFTALGRAPQYLRVTSTESEVLAFEVTAGVPTSTVQISNNNYHVAVRIGSRIYDAFTGPRGLTESEYVGRLFTPMGRVVLEEVASP
jgi:hypothetical protein